jgi:UDP-GlcNAc:undecaprenyl-phosphate GlcNAc-1-phosphate transferase
MLFFFAALVTSLVVTLLLVRGSRSSMKKFEGVSTHNKWMRDGTLRGLGRAGGAGVAAGLLASLLARFTDHAGVAEFGLLLLTSSLPVLAAGMGEDLTRRVSAATRLFAALFSAVLAGWLLNAWIVRIDLPWVDGALALPVVSVMLTCFAVAGVTHAFNIIDGFNGLAGGVAGLILLGLAYVAFKVGDIYVLAGAMTAIGAIAGFMFLNFPRGLVYLGDGGAYLVGFWIAELSVLLVARNPEVSPWFPVLLCSYPIFETIFSIYRRAVVRRSHPGLPDLAHLHHLIYKRLVRWAVGSTLVSRRDQRNSLTSTYLWFLTSVCVVPAVAIWRFTTALQVCCALFAIAYAYGYTRIARFRSPGWLVLHKKRDKHNDPPGDH